jgi:hypothetical protein
MSQVSTRYITDLSNNIVLPNTGSVLDIQYYRYDARPAFYYGYPSSEVITFDSATNTHPLKLILNNVSSPDNLIICEWMLSGEESNTSQLGCKITRNGSFIASEVGRSSTDSYSLWWQMFANWGFDGDNASTPHSIRILYIGRAGAVGRLEYGLWMASGGAEVNNLYYVNRTVGSTGQDAYENGVCTGVIYEISGPVSGDGGGET